MLVLLRPAASLGDLLVLSAVAAAGRQNVPAHGI